MGSRNLTSERGVARLLTDLEDLLGDSSTADTVFYIGSKETPIRCHSVLLRTRCKYYNADHISKLSSAGNRFPDVNPEIFRTFLLYVYTGKLSVEENSVFDLLCMASEFGMEDLEVTCEELLCRHLDPVGASALLNSALAAQLKPFGKNPGLQHLIDRCVSYVGENPAECLQASNFLSIPKETLIAIISSDQLCLEEEEVWRCVLRWAQFQARVETHVSQWTEEERLRVAEYLSPVISHVRLLLIDSRVFAEEVEPTGCVPMALSLERYRFAALPHQVGETDPRLTPRNTPRLFQASHILQSERVGLGRKLNEWFGDAKQSWRCVYRASLHGYSAEAFHSHCDGLAPTYTVAVIQNTKWICGGFSDVPWSRPAVPRYHQSNKAFLFSYDGNCSTRPQPIKFNAVKKHFAVCHSPSSGPIFGAGADLFISSHCNKNTDSYSNLPHSYESEDFGNAFPFETSVLTPSYNFSIADYEVFVPITGSES